MTLTDILIVGEHADGKPSASTLELAVLARTIADGGRSIVLALIGDGLDEVCEEAARNTGLDVLYLKVPGHTLFNGDIVTRALKQLVPELGVSLVLAAHTTQGLDYAPGLAVALKGACITGVNGLDRADDGALLFSRAICGGNFNTLIRPKASPVVLTVQAGSFPPGDEAFEPGSVTVKTLDLAPERLIVTGVEQSRAASSEFGTARIIISAGRGIGDEENLNAVRRFAALFPNSAVGGSRPLIDSGWLEYKHQVGITGATVSPDVYIACGISGSSQHIAGMNTAKFVVSINTDPHAAIFNVSDVCIVDDLVEFIEAFEEFVESEE